MSDFLNRHQKLRLNTIVGMISHIVMIMCGFIVPRLILKYYSSEVNGLISSISHFLSFISLAELGMGVVVQSSLYKPLAYNDEDEVSRIIISSDRFFRKIGAIFIVYVVVLAIGYPFMVDSTYNFWYTSTLIIAIAVSTYIQHFICMSYRLLIIADQVGYVQLSLQIIVQVINTVVCVILAIYGTPIQLLKLCSSFILVLQPLILALYVKRHYRLNKKLPLYEEPIKQKWNGLSQHIAHVVLRNTDIVILTILSTLSAVSVYNVYYLVVNGIKTMIMAATTGVQSMLGNMYAEMGRKELLNAFSLYEWLMHSVVVFFFSCTSVLIVPFIEVYTSGITDANYIVPVFGLLISLALMAYCIRLPYNAMVFAAGHYKQTQNSALIETGINILLSVVLVYKYGLVGVAVGTLVAMTYRTIYLACYLIKNILNRPIEHFLKHIAVDVCVFSISYFVTRIFDMANVSYLSWIVLAVRVAGVVGIVTIILNLIFYHDHIKRMLK